MLLFFIHYIVYIRIQHTLYMVMVLKKSISKQIVILFHQDKLPSNPPCEKSLH